jgi:hypothetical protein
VSAVERLNAEYLDRVTHALRTGGWTPAGTFLCGCNPTRLCGHHHGVLMARITGHTAATVVDAEALLEWVCDWAPTEVQSLLAVRPAFVAKLLAAVAEDGGWPDPTTGEPVPVAGVAFTIAPPTVAPDVETTP